MAARRDRQARITDLFARLRSIADVCDDWRQGTCRRSGSCCSILEHALCEHFRTDVVAAHGVYPTKFQGKPAEDYAAATALLRGKKQR